VDVLKAKTALGCVTPVAEPALGGGDVSPPGIQHFLPIKLHHNFKIQDIN